jgi:hypothetical protein
MQRLEEWSITRRETLPRCLLDRVGRLDWLVALLRVFLCHYLFGRATGLHRHAISSPTLMRMKSSTSTTHCVRSVATRVAGSSFALTRFFASRAGCTVAAPGRPAGVGNGRSVGVDVTGVDLTTPQAEVAARSSAIRIREARIVASHDKKQHPLRGYPFASLRMTTTG